MRVTVTGATGRIGAGLVAALQARGDEVTVLSRSPDRAGAALGTEAVAWRTEDEPAPAEALAGRDGVIHLAGEDVAQRWTDDARRRILESREVGTRNLVAGLRAADPRPAALVSASASAGRWRAAASGCRGSTATTSSRSTCARSTTPPGRAQSTAPRRSP